jgi:hypothetical protein
MARREAVIVFLAVLLFLAMLSSAMYCFEIAAERHRNPSGWFLGGLAFGPLAVIALHTLGPPSR